MPEFLSPGVFIEEVPSSLQTTLAVSTSTIGAAGFTHKGPADKAIYVSSLSQFERTFGSIVRESSLYLNMAAYFANGGRRAYIIRVVPQDAETADCRLQSQYVDQLLFKADGIALTWSATAATTALQAAAGDAPLVPFILDRFAGVRLRYRPAGSVASLMGTLNRTNTLAVVGTGVAVDFEGQITDRYSLKVSGATVDGDTQYLARLGGDQSSITVAVVVAGNNTPLSVVVVGNSITINSETDGAGVAITTALQAAAAVNVHPQAGLLVASLALGDGTGVLAAQIAAPLAPSNLPVFDSELDRIVPGTVVFSWRTGGVLQTLPVLTKAASIVTASNGAGSIVTLDTRTGRWSLKTVIAELPDAGLPILATYTAAGTTVTVTDDGAGVWGAPLQAGSVIDYADGSYTLTWLAPAVPHDQARVLASYTNNAWNLAPASKGVWGNEIRIQIYGNTDYYSTVTGQYSRYNVLVRLWNSVSSTYDVAEQFEELDFTDSTSPQYFPAVLNESSDYVQVEEPGSDYLLQDLNGTQRLFVPAGGDETLGGRAFSFVIPSAPVAARSIQLTYTDVAGVVRTVADNGAGLLVGDVDPAGTNTIVYSTGAAEVTLSVAVQGGTLVRVNYVTSPVAQSHFETFGDSAKNYTYGGVEYYLEGSNGTFDSINYGRSQFSAPTLLAPTRGIYALEKIEEILSVIVPDFAGDVTVSGDLLDYAAMRAALPHGGDRFIILTTPVGKNPQEAVDWYRYDFGRVSDYAAIYWPWISVADPLANNRPKLIPPLGHIAGVYARTDNNRNVAKAPAGTIDGQLAFLLGLEYDSSQGERDLIYPNKINPIASGTNIGRAVWGARTISNNTAWRYVPVRRLFMFLEKSVYNSTFWAVFEPNGAGLWSGMQQQISSFLMGLFNGGYFAGNSAQEAYFVICDGSNNDLSSIDQGQVICDIGVAPSKPAEFVRFRFSQKTL